MTYEDARQRESLDELEGRDLHVFTEFTEGQRVCHSWFPTMEGEVCRKNANGSYFVSWKRTTGDGNYAPGELMPI